MSRSGYSENCDGWELIRWRGAVKSAIRGKRGQTFLHEMKSALLELPEKKLIDGQFANQNDVCALGSVAVRRKMQEGMARSEAMKAVTEEWPDEMYEECGNVASGKLNIASAMAKEIMYINDDESYWDTSPEKRYEIVLNWVKNNIKEETK